MTPEEWEGCAGPAAMHWALGPTAEPGRLRLLACAYVRRIRPLPGDDTALRPRSSPRCMRGVAPRGTSFRWCGKRSARLPPQECTCYLPANPLTTIL
jgi:hypothetical protein